MYASNQPKYDNVLKPTILCIAESSHYLVGVIDSAHNLLPLDPQGKVISCSSLVEAKMLLRNKGILVADIEYQTAYDEMCGNAERAPCLHVVQL
ncbi:DUF6482 family protein [Psychrosphaera sp. 1_MG-2023]|uniref:DUF6482 family protein n=1 Tax=Psychrosphaera sp. 1_MG-2023 TaxID=3062643 RepID=UPI0026E15435|nr:DUF6482 family protein [Psychrosphaera sp. 1_MG-2023]MDO6719250.1 DUF6482 family protein [Psychrosphaera sp. 1_MG-2023]